MTTQTLDTPPTSDVATDPPLIAAGRRGIEWGPVVELLPPCDRADAPFERDQLAELAGREPRHVRAVRRVLILRGDPAAVSQQLGNSLVDGEHQGFLRGRLTIEVMTVEDTDGRCTRPGLKPSEADLVLAQLRELRAQLAHLYPGEHASERVANLARDVAGLTELLDCSPEDIFAAAKNRIMVLVELRKSLGLPDDHDPDLRGRFSAHELHGMVTRAATMHAQHKALLRRVEHMAQLLSELSGFLGLGVDSSPEDIPTRVHALVELAVGARVALGLDENATAATVRAAIDQLRATAIAKPVKAAKDAAAEAKRAIADLVDESPQDWAAIVKGVGELAKHAADGRRMAKSVAAIGEAIGFPGEVPLPFLQERATEIIRALRHVRELLDFPVQAELFPGGVAEALRELESDAAAVQPICEALGLKVDAPIAEILTTIGALRAAPAAPIAEQPAAAPPLNPHEILDALAENYPDLGAHVLNMRQIIANGGRVTVELPDSRSAQALTDIAERLGMPAGADPRDVVRGVELLLEDTGSYGKAPAPEAEPAAAPPSPLPGLDYAGAVCAVLGIDPEQIVNTPDELAKQVQSVMVDRVSAGVAPVARQVRELAQKLTVAEERLIAAQRMALPVGQPASAAAGMIGCRMIGWLARTLQKPPTGDQIEDFRRALEESPAVVDLISRVAASLDPGAPPPAPATPPAA